MANTNSFDVFTIRQGDSAPNLTDTLYQNGSPADLTGCSVGLVRQFRGVDRILVASIVNPTAGTVKYTWAPSATGSTGRSTDTSEAGDSECYWLVTYPDGSAASFPNGKNFTLSVIASSPLPTDPDISVGWTTVDTAAAYLGAALGSESWDALDESAQVKYLTTAYRMLANDTNYTWPSVTQAMKDAQTELAFYLVSNPSYMQRINLQNMGVDSMRIGDFMEHYASGPNLPGPVAKYPQIVMNLIEPYYNAPPAIGIWERHC